MPNIPPYTKFIREINDPGLTSDQNALSAQVEAITTWINGIAASLPAPEIYSITPENGPIGTVVRVVGRYLQGVTRVAIGAVDSLPFVSISSTVLDVTITPDVISDRIRVISDSGQAFGPFFTVPNTVPVLGSLSVSPNPVNAATATTFSVDVTDTDGVQEVQFFVKGTAQDVLIGSSSSPITGNNYQISWTPNLAGSFTVRAKAIDRRQGFAYSPYSALIVNAASLPAGVAPSIVVNTTTRQISASTTVSGDVIEQNISGGGWEPYDGPIGIGTAYRIAGTYRFRSIANNVHRVSSISGSPEIPAVVTGGGGIGTAPQNVTILLETTSPTIDTAYELVATANSSVGLVSATFYENGDLLGVSTTAPYKISYTPTTLGPTTIKVVFTDVNGNTSETVRAINVIDEPAEISITPATPTGVADDTNNTLTISHPLGLSQLLVSVGDAAYIPLTSLVIQVDNLARPEGYYKVKTKAASGRNESGVYSSPAFTVVSNPPATPAPQVIADDVLDALDFSSPFPPTEVLVSVDNGAFIPYSGPYQIGDLNRPEGYYRAYVRASAGRAQSATTSSPAFNKVPTTQPVAPTVTGNDTTNVLSATHPLGEDQILVAGANNVYAPYTGPFNVGTGAIDAGIYKFKTIATPSRLESELGYSPAFTADGTPPVTPTFNTILSQSNPNVDTVTFTTGPGTTMKINTQVDGTFPNDPLATAVQMLPQVNGVQIGQVDYNSNNTELQVLFTYAGVLYYSTLQSGIVNLVAS